MSNVQIPTAVGAPHAVSVNMVARGASTIGYWFIGHWVSGLAGGLGEEGREDRLGLGAAALGALDALAAALPDGHRQRELLLAPAAPEVIGRHRIPSPQWSL